MKIESNELGIVSLGIVLALLIMGLGYSMGQSTSDPTPVSLDPPEAPSRYQALTNEGTPPGGPEAGETPIATAGPEATVSQ